MAAAAAAANDDDDDELPYIQKCKKKKKGNALWKVQRTLIYPLTARDKLKRPQQDMTWVLISLGSTS